MKVWLSSVAVLFALLQVFTALWMYGRLPIASRPAWLGNAHRISGRLAFLISLPVAYHCLYQLAFQDTTTRVLAHSLLGCLFYGAFATKVTLIHMPGGRACALPDRGGARVHAARRDVADERPVVHHHERDPVALMLHAIDRVLAPLTWLVAAFAVAVLLIGPQVIGAEKPPPAPSRRRRDGRERQGRSSRRRCGGCHTLADAGTSGAVGPNLDDAAPDAATVKAFVRGGGGGMPAFGDKLSNAEIDAVAAYVSSVAGG